jgi:hypothetical protein
MPIRKPIQMERGRFEATRMFEYEGMEIVGPFYVLLGTETLQSLKQELPVKLMSEPKNSDPVPA